MDLKKKLIDAGIMSESSLKPQSILGHSMSEKLPLTENEKKMRPQRSSTYPKGDILAKLRRRSSSEELRRKFILRLATALHNYGSSAPRTEYLIERAADRIGVKTNIAVFPALILISFIVKDEHTERQETHLLTVEADMDADKLGLADELANQVGLEGHEVLVAYWRLRAIANEGPKFNLPIRLLSFGVLSGTASVLFFGGNYWDGLVSLVLGLVVGLLNLAASKHAVMGHVLEFITAIVVSFAARVLSIYFRDQSLCFFAMALSSLVWLLPGLSLTIGVSELVAKASVTGSARITSALFSALQLGFGLAIGERLVFWERMTIPTSCPGSNPAYWLKLVWFAGYTSSSNVLLNARLEQWTGMVLVSFAGWVVSELTSSLGDSGSVMSAFVIGITGTLYSHCTGYLPLSTKTSGILLLVPGGIGVKGVASILDKDVISGMGFVFDMMVVGLSITLGLLLAKIVLPAGLLGASKVSANTKSSLARVLQDEGREVEGDSSDDEEEHMAI